MVVPRPTPCGASSTRHRRARGPYKSGLATRQSIVDGAVRALICHGYAQASLQTMAAEAGVAKAVVHYHFPTRSDLIAAVIDHCAGAIEARFRVAAGSFGSPPDRMRGVCSFVATLLDECAPELRVLSELSAHAPHDPRLGGALRRHADIATAALSAELAAGGKKEGFGGATAAARMLLGTLHGILLMRDCFGPPSPSRAAIYAEALAVFTAPVDGGGSGAPPRRDGHTEDPGPDGPPAGDRLQEKKPTLSAADTTISRNDGQVDSGWAVDLILVRPGDTE